MATILLSLFIFGFAGWLIWRLVTGKKACEDCQTNCPIKKEQTKRANDLELI
ncbi:MAG: FeoB-associated Cys-rich membrane protein [Enterococcus sp.]